MPFCLPTSQCRVDGKRYVCRGEGCVCGVRTQGVPAFILGCGVDSKTDRFKMHKGLQKRTPCRGASSNAAGTRPGTKWASGGCGTLEIHSLFWVFLSAGPPGP